MALLQQTVGPVLVTSATLSHEFFFFLSVEIERKNRLVAEIGRQLRGEATKANQEREEKCVKGAVEERMRGAVC